MPVFSVGIGTILKYILIYIVTLFFPNVSIFVTGVFSYEFLVELGLNILLAPVFFKFLGLFKNTLNVMSTKDKIENV